MGKSQSGDLDGAPKQMVQQWKKSKKLSSKFKHLRQLFFNKERMNRTLTVVSVCLKCWDKNVCFELNSSHLC